MCLNLLDEREKNLSHVTETVFLGAVKDISSTAKSSHSVHQTLFTTFLQHNLQHITDGGLASTRLLQLCAESGKMEVRKYQKHKMNIVLQKKIKVW